MVDLLLVLEVKEFLKMVLLDIVKYRMVIVLRLEKMNLFELIGNMFCNIFSKNCVIGINILYFLEKYFFIVLLRFIILILEINFIYVFLLL